MIHTLLIYESHIKVVISLKENAAKKRLWVRGWDTKLCYFKTLRTVLFMSLSFVVVRLVALGVEAQTCKMKRWGLSFRFGLFFKTLLKPVF